VPEDNDERLGLPVDGKTPKTARARQMLQEVKRGVHSAVASAVADIARTPGAFLDSDAIWIFLTAMGWIESHALAFEAFGGHHPLDPRSTATEQQLARLMGASPRERARKYDEEFRKDVAAEMKRVEPYFPPAAALAVQLCQELALAFEEFARGKREKAERRRKNVVKRWNSLVRTHGVDKFPFPRLCEYCGKPLFLVAKERMAGRLMAPAKVHSQCQAALRAAGKRER
jgi:hypothetical protein